MITVDIGRKSKGKMDICYMKRKEWSSRKSWAILGRECGKRRNKAQN